MWPTAYCFAFEGSHVRAEDVFSSEDVSFGHGTVGQLIGGDNVDELLGAWVTNFDL